GGSRSGRDRARARARRRGHGARPRAAGGTGPVPVIAHWDDVEAHELRAGPIGGLWQALGGAAGAVGVGVNRVRLPAGSRSTAVHRHNASEEIFFALARDDCVVHRAREESHALIAGDDGLEYLVYGTRHPVDVGFLPRAGVVRI